MNPQELFNEAANLMNRLQIELIWAYGANARTRRLTRAINRLERRIARRKREAILGRGKHRHPRNPNPATRGMVRDGAIRKSI